nr:ribonuclease H-like domain-containing protein [Tanacetum cinerariifolium]
MEAIEKRFGGNTKTKKVQKTLLKQQFENFTGSSSKDLDQIHDRLQKLVSQLEIHGVSLSQKDVNLNQWSAGLSWGRWGEVVGLMGEWWRVAGVGGSEVEVFGGKPGWRNTIFKRGGRQ